MLNFMTKNKIENIEDIKKFDKDGYGFAEEMSLENKFVFVKNSQKYYKFSCCMLFELSKAIV